MYQLPIDIILRLYEFCGFKTKINFRSVNLQLYKTLNITDLKNIPCKYRNKLSNDVIKLYPYCQLLYASNNTKINCLTNLRNLRVLNAEDNSAITQETIQNLILLEELYVNGNRGISNVNHLSNLKYYH